MRERREILENSSCLLSQDVMSYICSCFSLLSRLLARFFVLLSVFCDFEQFTVLVELLQDMLEHVSRNQRNKLKLERLSISSNEGGPK